MFSLLIIITQDWDLDKNGTIDEHEFRSIVDSNGFEVSEDTFQSIFQFFDSEGRGSFRYDEFIAAVYSSSQPVIQ